MLRKKLMLLLLLLTLLVSVSTTDKARACSGDLCGCNIEAQACSDACATAPPNPTRPFACQVACARQQAQCGIACCGW